MLKKTILISVLVVFTHLIYAQISVGPNSPATAVNGSCNRSYNSPMSYTPATGVLLSDNVYASATHCACCDQHTDCLIATNFGFNIPTGALITGVTVEVEKHASGVGAIFQDNEVQLLKNGVEDGLDYRTTASWPNTDAYVTYGGCNNLWGTTWTAAEINAANFGVAIAGIDYTCNGVITSHIDHVRISVCYSIATDVANIYTTKVIIAPNPISDYMNVQTDFKYVSYEILDFTGRKIVSALGNENKIKVENLPKGLYFLKLSNENKSLVHKFIKK